MAKKNVRNMKVCGQNGYKYETIPEKSADDAGFFFSYRERFAKITRDDGKNWELSMHNI